MSSSKAIKLHKATDFKQRLRYAPGVQKWHVLREAVCGSKKRPDGCRIKPDEFAKAFLQKVTAITAKTPDSINDADFLEFANAVNNDSTFEWPQVIPPDVHLAIANLKSGAANLEHIAVECVTDCVGMMCIVLSKLINVSLEEGIYPRCSNRETYSRYTKGATQTTR